MMGDVILLLCMLEKLGEVYVVWCWVLLRFYNHSGVSCWGTLWSCWALSFLFWCIWGDAGSRASCSHSEGRLSRGLCPVPWSGLGHGGQAHQLRVSGSFAGLIVTQLDGNRGCHLSAQLLLSDPCPANSRCGGFPGPAALSPLLMESPGAPHPFLNLKTAPHLAGRAAFSPVCQDRCLSLPDVWCLTGSDFYVFLFSTVFCCCFPRQGGEQVSPFLAAASLPEAGSSRLPIFFVFCFLQLSYSQCLWESFLTIISTSLSFYIHF